MTTLFLDLETYSETPIKHGTYVYAANCEITVVVYAFGDGEVQVWDVTSGRNMPKDLYYALRDNEVRKVIHNSMFDRNVLRLSPTMFPYGLKQHGKIKTGIIIPPETIDDTMIIAYSHSLPGGLGLLCQVLGISVDESKDKRGRDLINLFCKPRPKNHTLRRATRETHPKEWQEFLEYAKSDIRAMRAIYHKMPRWNYRDCDQHLWHLDQHINDRGFRIDTDLARGAIDAINNAQKDLKAAIVDATFGQVGSATQRDRLLGFILSEYGVDLPDLTKSTLERRINDPELPAQVRELLAIRAEASKSSTSKYAALLKAISLDERLRGTIQFRGASRTGRDAGRTFQPQNLYRSTMKREDIDFGIEAIKAGTPQFYFDNVMDLTANTIRGCIIPSRGRKLVVSDLSNIEGRFAAWASQETWKCNAFAQYDNGIGEDLYKVAYAKAFNIDAKAVTKDQRQIGKVMELMLQYEGGVGAFITGALTYRIDLNDMADKALQSIPSEIYDEAEKYLAFCERERRPTFGLSRETFIACDSLKRMWRKAHPQISSIWGELKEAMTMAVLNEKTNFPVRRFTVRRDGTWTRIRLPSGRVMCYPQLRIDDTGQLSYAGINPYTRQWGRIKTYGGKLLENLTQGGSLDVFANSWKPVDDADYRIILRVHDELITEAPNTPEFTVEGLSKLLSTPPQWADGLPLAAGGFEGQRYRKD